MTKMVAMSGKAQRFCAEKSDTDGYLYETISTWIMNFYATFSAVLYIAYKGKENSTISACYSVKAFTMASIAAIAAEVLMWALGSDNLQTMYDSYVEETTCPDEDESCNISGTPLEMQKRAFTFLQDSFTEMADVAFWKKIKQTAYAAVFGAVAVAAVFEMALNKSVTCGTPTPVYVPHTPMKIFSSVLSKLIERMFPHSISSTMKPKKDLYFQSSERKYKLVDSTVRRNVKKMEENGAFGEVIGVVIVK